MTRGVYRFYTSLVSQHATLASRDSQNVSQNVPSEPHEELNHGESPKRTKMKSPKLIKNRAGDNKNSASENQVITKIIPIRLLIKQIKSNNFRWIERLLYQSERVFCITYLFLSGFNFDFHLRVIQQSNLQLNIYE
jgi:hypothetical protein